MYDKEAQSHELLTRSEREGVFWGSYIGYGAGTQLRGLQEPTAGPQRFLCTSSFHK